MNLGRRPEGGFGSHEIEHGRGVWQCLSAKKAKSQQTLSVVDMQFLFQVTYCLILPILHVK